MGLIKYKDIDLKQSINKELVTFDFNGSEIGVVPYLTINDKYDLVMITLQKSLEQGVYNRVKLSMYFDLHLVYMYTNIEFDAEDRLHEDELYDNMTRSGLIDAVKVHISSSDIIELWGYIEEMEKIIMKYRNTFGSVFSAFVEQLPQNMEKAKEIIGEFDQEKFKGIVDLTKNIQGMFPSKE